MQIIIRLSTPTYITAPLRTNQKYAYRKIKLQVYKITRYSKKSDLYTILYQRLTNAFLKGALLRCKRASFTPQKSTFYHAKGHLLLYKKTPAIPNLWIFITTFSCPCSFHNKRVSLPLHYYNNTIKTSTFQFSCHSCHSSLRSNTLITSHLCKMLKVIATKNKTILGV